MGQITAYFISMSLILCAFFVFASLFSDASTAGGWTGVQQFQSFNKTSQYGSYMQNRTETLRQNLETDASTNNNNYGFSTLANIFFTGGSLAATSLFAMVDIGIAILQDLGLLMIPAFFIGMAATVLLFKFGAQVLEALRLGRI